MTNKIVLENHIINFIWPRENKSYLAEEGGFLFYSMKNVSWETSAISRIIHIEI